MKKFVVLFLLLGWWSVGVGNNVRIEGDIRVVAADVDAVTGIAKVKLQLQWDNSWRDAFNYDAVYLFLKYKVDVASEKWHHAYLADAGHVLPDGFEYWLSKSDAAAKNRNEGIFIYRSGKGYGNVRGAGDKPIELELQWDITANPNRKLDRPMFTQGQVFTSAMGIEMVYVPRGAFRVGDTESSKTFFVKDVVFPAKYDLMGTTAVESCSSTDPLPSNPPEFAMNRMNDVSTDNSNAWVGVSSRAHTDYHDAFEINFVNQVTIRSLAIESIAGGTPVTWKLQGFNNTSGNWMPIYSGTGDQWASGSRQAYPCTRTIRIIEPNQTAQRYSQYRILIDSMPNPNTAPVIKNLSMSEHDIFADMDNSVLITGLATKMDNRYGLYANDEDSTAGWSGTLSAQYPNGYGAFFVMKYEVSQEQYAAFLNKLEAPQQRARTIGASLETTLPDQYVFGPYKTKSSARNGIKLAEIGAKDAPYVFVNDLDEATEYSQDGDGQTIACNFLNAGDMMAYADWCGLRPLTELEFEKMARRPYPDPALRGEYAWNTNDNFIAATTIEAATVGKRTEKTANGNVNATGRLSGPLRSGIFAMVGTSQIASGSTFWGVMDLSGNLSGIYYNANTEGRMFRGTESSHHGNGVISESGLTDVRNDIWPLEPKAFSLKGGNYRDAVNLTKISDRSRNLNAFATINEVTGLKDSTMTFRLGRTAPILTVKAEVTLENGKTSAEANAADSVCSGSDYTIAGKVPAEVTGAYEIAWFMSSDGGANWDVIEGESGPSLNLRNMRNINSKEDIFQKYWYQRKIFSNQMDVLQSNPVAIWVINHAMELDRLKDTVDVYDYSHGVRVEVHQSATFAWTWLDEQRSITPEYIIKAGKIQKHYFKYTDFSIDGTLADVQDNRVHQILLEVTVMKRCVLQDTIEVFVKAMPDKNYAILGGSGNVNPAFKCGDLLEDNDEGVEPAKIYRTIEIDGRCWFADNLNRKNYTKGNRGADLCYSGVEANCDKYGRLYNFYAATLTTYEQRTTDPVGKQGICPKGWHLPTNNEWIALYAAFGEAINTSRTVANGKEVKSSLNDWTYVAEANIGTNQQRFAGLPGGGYFYSYSGSYATYANINTRNGYGDLGSRAWWWTSTTTGTLWSFWHASSTSWVMQYMPYYVRMDQDGQTYFNVNTYTAGTYAFLTNTIFHSAVHYYILDSGATNNNAALDRVKTNFYMSVRCIQNEE